MSTAPQTSPEQILRWWQRRYGTLTPELRRRFLQRSEVKQLSSMRPKTVLKALDSSPELAKILAAARPVSKNVPAIVKSLDRAIGSSGGSPATLATYGSGLVHSAGRPEARNGYRCSSCGAFVPDGAAHDC